MPWVLPGSKAVYPYTILCNQDIITIYKREVEVWLRETNFGEATVAWVFRPSHPGYLARSSCITE
jgi:hypothetical protein